MIQYILVKNGSIVKETNSLDVIKAIIIHQERILMQENIAFNILQHGPNFKITATSNKMLSKKLHEHEVSAFELAEMFNYKIYQSL